MYVKVTSGMAGDGGRADIVSTHPEKADAEPAGNARPWESL